MTNQVDLGKTSKPDNPYYTSGKCLREVEKRYNVLAADVADGDTYILAESLSYADRIDSVLAPNGVIALTSATDNDLGFYKKDKDGNLTAIDADVLWSGVDLSSASTGYQDLLYKNGSIDRVASIGELLGKSVEDQPANLCLVLTTNVKSTAANTIFNLKTVIEKANTE